MFKFSKKSEQKLQELDPKLQLILKDLIQVFDFTIIEGYRDEATQNKYFAEGKSKLKFPNGKHNTKPSKAVDIAPYSKAKKGIDWEDKNSFFYMAGLVMGIAIKHGVKIRWGGDWDMDTDFLDQKFNDLPHFELA